MKRSKLLKRKHNLMHRYKLTLAGYDELLKQQKGKCAICNSKWGKEMLCVDHNHLTGKVRGLLCRLCNLYLAVVEQHGFSLFKRIEGYLNK